MKHVAKGGRRVAGQEQSKTRTNSVHGVPLTTNNDIGNSARVVASGIFENGSLGVTGIGGPASLSLSDT